MAIWFNTHLRRTAVKATTIRRLTQSILAEAGQPTADLSLSLVGRTRMRSLNRLYRERDYPTDVLAFPTAQIGTPGTAFLGDVVICVPIAIAQASRFENTADEEMLRLLIHGTLHLLGYDHEQSKREATRMQRKERTIANTLSPVPRLIA